MERFTLQKKKKKDLKVRKRKTEYKKLVFFFKMDKIKNIMIMNSRLL